MCAYNRIGYHNIEFLYCGLPSNPAYIVNRSGTLTVFRLLGGEEGISLTNPNSMSGFHKETQQL